MKDIKSFLIGFLSCACMFLLMGATDSEQQVEDTKVVDALNEINSTLVENGKNGRYQVSNNSNESYRMFESVIDTKTGEVIRYDFHTKYDWNKEYQPIYLMI